MSFKETEIGKIPLDWDVAKLGDVADVLSGFAFKSKDFIDNGVPVIKIKNIVPPYVTKDDAVYVSQELYESSEKYQLNYNDILISMTGSNYNQLSSAVGKVGRVRLKDEPMLLNQRVGKIITNEKKCNKEFLYYNISTMETRYRLALSAGGSANQANVSPKQIKSLIIPYPPLEEQKAIAHILSTLDDKIEVNNQINKTLENMAQAIFKQWFVDFEFPNEDGEPYKYSGGEMVESELGMIPKGWKVVKLNSVVDIRYGKNLPTKKLLSAGYPVFGGNGQIGFYSEYLYENSQVLIACRGAASGKVIVSLPYSFITNNSLVLERKDSAISHEYLLQFCLENEFYNYATGSAQPQITIANLANVYILLPERTLMNKFSSIRKSIDSKCLALFDENKRIVGIRDLLLPKLMSGEIRVPLDEEGEVS